jgi:hypothetical protein
MNIPMTSNVFKIIKINKKSSARMFEDLSVGDEIIFTIEIEHLGTSRGRTYAPYIKIENIKTKEYTLKSFNQITSILSCFELQ